MMNQTHQNCIPLQVSWMKSYHHYEVITHNWGTSCLPIHFYHLDFRKEDDNQRFLFPNGCLILSFKLTDEKMTVSLLGRVSETMYFSKNEACEQYCLRLPPQLTFGSSKSLNSEALLDLQIFSDIHAFKRCLYAHVPLEHKLSTLLTLLDNTSLKIGFNTLVNDAVGHMIDLQSDFTIAQISKKENYSERYLRKSFTNFVGICPKRIAEILRLQNVISSHIQHSRTPCVYENGYYDLAHYNKRIKQLTGFSSTEFKAILQQKAFPSGTAHIERTT